MLSVICSVTGSEFNHDDAVSSAKGWSQSFTQYKTVQQTVYRVAPSLITSPLTFLSTGSSKALATCWFECTHANTVSSKSFIFSQTLLL